MKPKAKVIHSSGHVELDINVIPLRYMARKDESKSHKYL